MPKTKFKSYVTNVFHEPFVSVNVYAKYLSNKIFQMNEISNLHIFKRELRTKLICEVWVNCSFLNSCFIII